MYSDKSLQQDIFVGFFLQKATLVSAVDVYEEEESELLISFNRKLHKSCYGWIKSMTLDKSKVVQRCLNS